MRVSISSDKQPRAGGSDPAPKPSRRAFSPAYKLAMVAEHESAASGEKGGLLRREVCIRRTSSSWTRARDAGLLGQPEGWETGSGTLVAGRSKKKSGAQLELEKQTFNGPRIRCSSLGCRASPVCRGSRRRLAAVVWLQAVTWPPCNEALALTT